MTAQRTGTRAPEPELEGSLLGLLTVLLTRWRLVVGLPFGVAVVAAVVSLLLPPTYTALTSFVPETSTQNRLPAGIAGLAGQLGLDLGAQATQSPRFYADVLRSRGLLEQVLLTGYPDPRPGAGAADSARLLQLLRVKGKTPADSLAHGVKALAKRVSVDVDPLTNIVRVRVDSRYPALAASVATRVVDLLNAFNTLSRQSQARERRRFVEARLIEGERGLRRAEEDLRNLYASNRLWQQSPQLVFEEGRLRRRVEIQQEVFLTLNREFETARIEEVNDTPVLTVVDSAAVPQERARPRRVRLVIVWGILGLIAGVFGAFGAEYFARLKAEDGQLYGRFRRVLHGVADDLHWARRLVLRSGPGQPSGDTSA